MGLIKSDYEVLPASMTSSFCPRCGAGVRMLSSEVHDRPRFYLCVCGFVGHIGVADVRRKDDGETPEREDLEQRAQGIEMADSYLGGTDTLIGYAGKVRGGDG